jgi:hypothetical protein
MAVPLAWFFISLHETRKREFAADARSAALTGDPRAMISSLARVVRNNDNPTDMHPMVEWFSSHPSTRKRITTLAAAARLDPVEVESLCRNDQPGEPYEIPAEESAGDIFTPVWQKANAGTYSWAIVLGSGGAGLLVAWLLDRFAGYRILTILGGIVLGCALTKGAAATVMSLSYARLKRKLAEKLGVGGQLVGLAMDSEARVYDHRRFSDAGLMRFENGRLSYRSERVTIALNPADVLEVGMVAAAPSNWFRRQPMVRFRNPESGQTHAFIVHTLDWLATQQSLFRKTQRWRATGTSPGRTSPESTLIDGFNPIAGQRFVNPTIKVVARAFLITGGVALVAANVTCFILKAQWQFVVWVLVVTACAYVSMLLPAMLYRPARPVGEPRSPVDTR